MKKIIIIIAFVSAFMPALANSENPVTPQVLQAFQKQFTGASQVNWIESSEGFKAQFEWNQQYISAIFDSTGVLHGIERNILSTQLPFSLGKSLKEKYKFFWISGLVEFSSKGKTFYYVTVEDANTRIVLKSFKNSWIIVSNILK